MIRFPVRRLAAASISFSLVLAAPGYSSYAAAQTVVRAAQPGSPAVPVTLRTTAAGANAVLAPITTLSPSLSAFSAPSISPAIAPVMTPAIAPAAPVATRADAPASSLLPAAKASLSASAESARAELAAAGDIGRADAPAAAGLGRRLEALLTGAPALRAAGELPAAAGGMASFSESRHLARPAGDSIRQAAAASDEGAPPPAPPAQRQTEPREPKGPFWPKLLAAGLAVVPAVFLGWPLIAAEAFLLGGLTLGASAALAMMPFLGENSPRFLRVAPGALVAGMGLAAFYTTLSLTVGLGVAVAPAMGWSGALALIGGWGLARYGLGRGDLPRAYKSVETLSAWFGGVAAVAGVGIAALGTTGAVSLGLLWLTYPLALLLWLHLPSWVGHGALAVGQGLYAGAKGLTRVASSTHRDTTLLDRLSRFSERHWEASKWNAVWLSVIWTPIVLVEAAKFLLGAAAGLYAGVVQAPLMFAWGAAHKLRSDSKATVFLAEWTRFAFDKIQNGKKALYNRFAAKLVPLTNSETLATRALGAAGLLGLQLAWLAYALVGTPLLSLAGLLFAFGRAGAYDAARHDPERLKIDRDDKIDGGKLPDEGDKPAPGGPAPLLPKLLAASLALGAGAYFVLTMFTAFSMLQLALFAPLALSLAAMPFVGPNSPAWLKGLPGRVMTWNGLALLVSGHALIAGLLAAVGGWGFGRFVKARGDEDRRFDDGQELGAYFGALGSLVAVGAAWTGVAGTWAWASLGLAAVTGIFLYAQLPRWVWSGFGRVFSEMYASFRAWAKVMNAWAEGDFMENLGAHARFWLKKTYWNGVWLSAIWVPVGALALAELLLSAALGLVSGVVRAPVSYLAGAYARAKPDGKADRFFEALLEGWRGSAEGSRGAFRRLTGFTEGMMKASSPVSGRPTLGAVLGLVLHELIKVVWLAAVLALSFSGASLLWGVYKGLRAAFGAKPPANPDAK